MYGAALQAFRSEDTRDSGEIVRYADLGPCGCVKQGLHRRQAVVTKFENENPSRQDMLRRLRDEVAIKLVAFFATVKRNFRLVLADFAHQSHGFAPADVGWIADDQVKRT